MEIPELNLQTYLDNQRKSKLLPAPPPVAPSPAASKLVISSRLHPFKVKPTGLIIPKFSTTLYPRVSTIKTVPGTNFEDRSASPDKALEGGGVSFNPIPLINAATYAAASKGIRDIERTQLNRKVLFQPTPQLSVRAIQDLTPEQLAAQDQAISAIQAEEYSSDPVANLIAKGVAASTRGKARTEAIGQRVDQLKSERARFDEQTRQNQQLAAETEAKNIETAQQDSDLKLQARTNALAARQELNVGTLEQMAKNIVTIQDYNVAADAANQEAERNKTQAQIDAHLRAAALETSESERTRHTQEAEKLAAGYTPKQISRWGQASRLTMKGRSYKK